jgi:hypothetical protein
MKKQAQVHWDALQDSPRGIIRVTQRLYLLQGWNTKYQDLEVYNPATASGF